MTGTELAIKLGFTISKEGVVTFEGKPRKTSIRHSKRNVTFTFRHNKHKYQAYAGKLQAYNKFGNIALTDTTYYLDGNCENVSYDIISLLSIEIDKARNASTKVCSNCGKELPISQFCFKDKVNNIRSPRCLECDRASKRESYRKHYASNRDKFNQRRKIYENDNKEFINSIKQSGCLICKENDVACLDFHHLQDKEFNISTKINSLSKENLRKEIDKCVVLCSNCHRKLHYYNLSIEELRQFVSVPKTA